MPQDDVWVMLLITLSFLLLMLLLGHQRNYIRLKMRRFFRPTNRIEKPSTKTTAERYLPLLAALAMVASCGVACYVYLCTRYPQLHAAHGTGTLLGGCIVLFAAYHLLRWMLYWLVNWVFFERKERHLWQGGYNLLLLGETVMTFALMCLDIFYMLELTELAWTVIICYFFLRFLLISSTKRIFFPKFYGILHLFAYICTLETIPVLVLWKFYEAFVWIFLES